jgi:hypothetical protein
MPTKLTEKAVEGSTFGINAVFYDENSATMAPNSVFWTLTDQQGTIINSRTNIGITPQESVDIVLQGNDLAVPAGKEWFDEIKLFCTITGNYNSDLGSNLPLKDVIEFEMLTLTAINSP